jgi:maltooligosyltrehalose trehalohydrolase
MTRKISLGATYQGNGRCRFLVWAPRAGSVSVHLVSPRDRLVPLEQGEKGYHSGEAAGVEPGSRYFYLLNGQKERPDPASRYQPDGVHGPSQVVDPGAFDWADRWWPVPARQDLIFYEIHVGAYTQEGTFDAVIPHLDGLRELGATAIELMPVAQFPGSRNWGYDGVYPFSVQDSYGGPEGLQRLVDSCHRAGLAVFLDVVYNHLGPEGNYLEDFGPYFTNRYLTPWGPALNFDGPFSDEVRRFFIESALWWLVHFHIDGFRLDAVHAITDKSARPFLEEFAVEVHSQAEQLGRRAYIIVESDLNDPRLVRPVAAGGYGLDGQWSDDFHHALHVLLTGERSGYYQDFGSLRHLARALQEGYTYTGQYSGYRQRRHGRSPGLCTAGQLVVFAQNHDQVGNRALGERLSVLAPFDRLKLAAGMVLLSPYIPLLFMGEEYGETAPFQYFTSHSDPELARAVRTGRREEFSAFGWGDRVPDPQDEKTFQNSRLNHQLRRQGHHRVLYEFYRQLIRLRRELPALSGLDRDNMEVAECGREMLLSVRRWNGDSEIWAVFSFAEAEIGAALPVPEGRWRKRFDSAEEQWLGGGSVAPAALASGDDLALGLIPGSFVLYERIQEES